MSYVQKFSIKGPGHEAARQRENQRRHRARVKTHISELEATLANTQSRLDDALGCIDNLTAEVQRLQHALQQQGPTPQLSVSARRTDESVSSGPGAAVEDRVPQRTQGCGSSQCEKDASFVDEFHPVEDYPSERQDAGSESLMLSSRGSLDPSTDCPLLPPPSPGESTMTCRDAFSIIRERSVFGFDFDAAIDWLKPGFRRAIVAGGGCRVQTHILFSFVDRIT
ncbi:hypothetical protein B0T25DRAFT_250877 [Lasiosphaeria hispida]|uniref:BZIP domain-containing protein n=1 Tax=Lasiosphaeria hispida TaxID=260671 RepID=A0AAJ0HFZ2_9PEZI|nr:hypothetical protein B0T25DRAFT_250877 [Lasiosphaeria hispida]